MKDDFLEEYASRKPILLMMTTKQLDQKIEDVKLSGQLLVSRFADMLEIEAEVLKEKKIDGSDLYGDSKNAVLKECLQENINGNSR